MQMSFRFSFQRKSQQNADHRLPWRCATQTLPKNSSRETLVSVKGFKSTVLIQERISTANEGSIANSDKNINKI